MVEQRTALANQARSLAAQQGVEILIGIYILQQRLPDITDDAEQFISPMLRQLLFSLPKTYTHFIHNQKRGIVTSGR